MEPAFVQNRRRIIADVLTSSPRDHCVVEYMAPETCPAIYRCRPVEDRSSEKWRQDVLVFNLEVVSSTSALRQHLQTATWRRMRQLLTAHL